MKITNKTKQKIKINYQLVYFPKHHTNSVCLVVLVPHMFVFPYKPQKATASIKCKYVLHFYTTKRISLHCKLCIVLYIL